MHYILTQAGTPLLIGNIPNTLFDNPIRKKLEEECFLGCDLSKSVLKDFYEENGIYKGEIA